MGAGWDVPKPHCGSGLNWPAELWFRAQQVSHGMSRIIRSRKIWFRDPVLSMWLTPRPVAYIMRTNKHCSECLKPRHADNTAYVLTSCRHRISRYLKVAWTKP